MKGAIFKGIQEFATFSFGAEAWQKVVQLSNLKIPFFIAGDDYPDEIATVLIRAASEVSGLSEETVMIEFGKYWIVHTAPAVYPTLLWTAGNSVETFLCNMNRVHSLVTRNLSGAHPPQFEYEKTASGALQIRYISRRGLCPVLKGLIIGVGLHFNESLCVSEIACMYKGDEACVMEVVFA